MGAKYVYLAGPVSHLNFGEAKGWRDEVSNKLCPPRFITLDPLRGKESLTNVGKMLPSGYSGKASDRAIFSTCRWDVERCDVVLVNFTDSTSKSLGTAFEMAWAYARGKYIVVAMDKGNIHDHAFVNETAGIILPTLDEAVEYIKQMVI